MGAALVIGYHGFISFHCDMTLAAGSICSNDISTVYFILPQIPYCTRHLYHIGAALILASED